MKDETQVVLLLRADRRIKVLTSWTDMQKGKGLVSGNVQPREQHNFQRFGVWLPAILEQITVQFDIMGYLVVI